MRIYEVTEYGVLFSTLLKKGALAQTKALRRGGAAHWLLTLPCGVRWAPVFGAAMGACLHSGAAVAFHHLSRAEIKERIIFRSMNTPSVYSVSIVVIYAQHETPCKAKRDS